VLLLNEFLLLLFISLSTQSGNFWVHPCIFICNWRTWSPMHSLTSFFVASYIGKKCTSAVKILILSQSHVTCLKCEHGVSSRSADISLFLHDECSCAQLGKTNFFSLERQYAAICYEFPDNHDDLPTFSVGSRFESRLRYRVTRLTLY